MKINNIGLRAINAYNPTQSVKKTQNNSASFADKIEISSAAKEMQVTSAYSTERAEKVNREKRINESDRVQSNSKMRRILFVASLMDLWSFYTFSLLYQ